MKNNANKRFSHLLANKVLLDAKRACSLWDSVSDDEQLFRIYWVTCLALLRTISDVVNRFDCKQNPSYESYWEQRKKYLTKLTDEYKTKPFDECPEDYLFWSRLMADERNCVIHEYKPGFSDIQSMIGVFWNGQDVFDQADTQNDPNIYRAMGDLEYWGDMDCRDWISSALEWWEKELTALVDSDIRNLKNEGETINE